MGVLYSVKKVGDRIVVESQNANAKQVFFGWGGSGEHAAFYGREVPHSWGPGHEMRWRWDLSPGAVQLMLRNLNVQLTQPAYKDKGLERAARELQTKLRGRRSPAAQGGRRRSRR